VTEKWTTEKQGKLSRGECGRKPSLDLKGRKLANLTESGMDDVPAEPREERGE